MWQDRIVRLFFKLILSVPSFLDLKFDKKCIKYISKYFLSTSEMLTAKWDCCSLWKARQELWVHSPSVCGSQCREAVPEATHTVLWAWLRFDSRRTGPQLGTANSDYDFGQISELLIMSSKACWPEIREYLATKYMLFQTSLLQNTSSGMMLLIHFWREFYFHLLFQGHTIHILGESLSLQLLSKNR